MIRINLLAVSGARGGRRPLIDLGQKVTVACSVILVVTVVVIGWRFWSIRQQVSELSQDLMAADQEIARLNPVLAQVQASDAQRAQLAQRVGLIEELRQGQGGPVRMLDELSRALPDGLWLSELEQPDGALVVRGQALALGSLSDFVANLESSGYFGSPVEILDGQLNETDQGELVEFELRATFDWEGP